MGRKIKDLNGQKFGKLIVLNQYYREKNKTFWKCQCQCGNIKYVYNGHLQSGHTQSCGCVRNEKSAQRLQRYQKENYEEWLLKTKNKNQINCINIKNIKDLTGKIYGYLQVLEITDQRKFKSVVWKCKCLNCNSICYMAQYELQLKHKISCGCINYKSKGEEKIRKILSDNNINFQTQKTFKTCKFLDSNALARFDFFINKQYLIEYDGIQHFMTNDQEKGYFNKKLINKIHQHDKIKNQWCKENNIPLIRIPYTKFDTLCLEDLLLETSNFKI